MRRFVALVCGVLLMGSTGSIVSAELSIIPRPVKITEGEGTFALSQETVVYYVPGTLPEAEYFAGVIAPATGFTLQVKEMPGRKEGGSDVTLLLDSKLENLGAEGYHLRVMPSGIELSAFRPAGVFYGIQTIRQMLPEEVFSSERIEGVPWEIPVAEITDMPRFEWRGHLFDVCRHFFDKETVKRSIDLLALHKMNRLHWHLTEDQGWRLALERYPKVTEIGAWRTEKDGSTHGGYYTRDDVREIVEYAASRHIMVVPEIEMPGHASAALASYPFLGCTGGPYKVANKAGVMPDVYCAGSDDTMIFIKNVLDEVMLLFPSPFIHIGGDECPNVRWEACPKCQARIKAEGLADEHELQSWFIKQVDAYLTDHGRRMIGWDEILEGGLAPGAIVQSWRGVDGGIQAASEGHDVVMSPYSHCYLDYSYSSTPLEQSYSYEPIPEGLPADKAHHVLGLEGNLWSEYVADRDRLDFQVYPRLTALAEVGWSPKEKRDWESFQERMKNHIRRFELLGVKYGEDIGKIISQGAETFANWKPDQMSEEGVVLDWDATAVVTENAMYSFIFYYTKGAHGLGIQWAALLENGKEIARDTHSGWSGGDKRNVLYKLPVREYKKEAKYTLRAETHSDGGTDSAGDVMVKSAELE